MGNEEVLHVQIEECLRQLAALQQATEAKVAQLLIFVESLRHSAEPRQAQIYAFEEEATATMPKIEAATTATLQNLVADTTAMLQKVVAELTTKLQNAQTGRISKLQEVAADSTVKLQKIESDLCVKLQKVDTDPILKLQTVGTDPIPSLQKVEIDRISKVQEVAPESTLKLQEVPIDLTPPLQEVVADSTVRLQIDSILILQKVESDATAMLQKVVKLPSVENVVWTFADVRYRSFSHEEMSATLFCHNLGWKLLLRLLIGGGKRTVGLFLYRDSHVQTPAKLQFILHNCKDPSKTKTLVADATVYSKTWAVGIGNGWFPALNLATAADRDFLDGGNLRVICEMTM